MILKTIKITLKAGANQITQEKIFADWICVLPDTAAAYIGDSSVSSATGYTIPTANLGMFRFDAPRGEQLDLSQVYLAGTTGNFVIVLYPA